ncbi:MAG: hypothetical protein ACKVI1_02230, partial [Flavobacteriales bacterium]
MTYLSLIKKLDAFVRKYYRNKAIRGLLIATALLTAGFLIFTLAEYFGRFGILGRTVLFWSFTASVVGVVVGMVAVPLLKLVRLGKIISHEEASEIVGNHFPEVKDKLLNTLQLQRQVDGKPDTGGANVALLLASIDQRTAELGPVSFTNAIDLRENSKYLKYAIGPVVILVAVLLWRPGVVSEPAERLMQHRTSFVPPAPFRFELVSTPLKAPVGDRFDFLIRVVGNTIPSSVFLEEDGNRYRMERIQSDVFRYAFNALRSDVTFRCSANGWNSPDYTLLALPVPTVTEFSIVASPPSYTGLDVITQNNHGDLLIPEGTSIRWECRVKDADRLRIRVGDSLLVSENVTGRVYSSTWGASSTLPYWFIPENDVLGAVDSMRFSLRVVADRRPVIRMVEVEDSVVRKRRYFSGGVSDDYGFSKLAFAVKKVGEKDAVYTVLERPSGKSDEFYFTWEMMS